MQRETIYIYMFSNVGCSSAECEEGAAVGKTMAAVQTQLSITLNMVVATLTAYGIGYYCATYFTDKASHVSAL